VVAFLQKPKNIAADGTPKRSKLELCDMRELLTQYIKIWPDDTKHVGQQKLKLINFCRPKQNACFVKTPHYRGAAVAQR
jgi:hypothetical protein